VRQIDEHARELQKSRLRAGDIARAGTRLRDLTAYEDLRDLRDVVEDAAECIAGRGRKPDLVLDPDQDWPSAVIVNDRVASISVFGRTYEIRPAIFAAIAFVKTLPQTDAEEGASLHQG
jgi:hypothetical protein